MSAWRRVTGRNRSAMAARHVAGDDTPKGTISTRM